MNNIVMRKMDITSGFAPISSVSLIVSVTISCPPSNVDDVFFVGDDGVDVPWMPGEWHEFRSIDLSSIQIKGTVGDIVTIIGGTW